MDAAAGWREETFPVLLPPMCLNRRYQAEGVRLYSQQTWERVMASEGRAWVARLAPQARFAQLFINTAGILKLQSARANSHEHVCSPHVTVCLPSATRESLAQANRRLYMLQARSCCGPSTHAYSTPANIV